MTAGLRRSTCCSGQQGATGGQHDWLTDAFVVVDDSKFELREQLDACCTTPHRGVRRHRGRWSLPQSR